MRRIKGAGQEELAEVSPCNEGLAVVKQEREGREIWWVDSQMLEQF